MKLNETEFRTRRGCHVPKYAACLNPFSFQVVSGNILYLGKLKEIPSVSLFRKKISIKPFINKRVFCNLI